MTESDQGRRRPQVDIVVPVHNEEQALPAFHARLSRALESLPYEFCICYVDDGSSDGTDQVLASIRAADLRVGVLRLSRNFGHQAALSAGLDRASGDAVITIDGDGQHPPELIPQMLELYEVGYQVVLTQRSADEASLFKRWSSTAFYSLINAVAETRLVPGSADFRLLSRQAADALRGMREYHRFLRGMVSWIGYRTVILPFKPGARMGGKSKYSLRKMVRLAMDAIFSFSLMPLYLGIALGLFFLALAAVEILYVLSLWLSRETATLAPGWSSLMFVVLFVGATLSIILGIVGLYVGYIFQEVKRRPPYLVEMDARGKQDGAGGRPSDDRTDDLPRAG